MFSFIKKNLGVIVLLILLILLVFYYYYGIFSYNYLVPPGDDPTRHMTEAQGIMDQGFTKAWEGSLDPPLFHTLLAIVTFFVGQDIVTTTLYIVPFIFILSYFAFYFAVKKLFKNEVLALLAMTILIFISRQPRLAYNTGTYLNLFAGLCLFVFGLAFLKSLFLSKKIDYRKIVLCFLFFGGVMLTHSLSTSYMVMTLILTAVILFILKLLTKISPLNKYLSDFKEIYFKNFLVLAVALIILILPFTYHAYFGLVLDKFQAQYDQIFIESQDVIEGDVTQEVVALPVPWKAFINHLGAFVLAFSLISLPFFIIKCKDQMAKIIVLCWALAIFIGTRFSFFILPNRFAVDLALPLIVVIAFFFLYLYDFMDWKRSFLAKIIFVLILIFNITIFTANAFKYNEKVRLQNSDAEALLWIRNNTDSDSTILVYPKTLAMRSWGSYVNLLTGRKVIDGSDCREDEGLCPWIYNPNSEAANNFYLENNIDFVYAGKKVLGTFATDAKIDWNYQNNLLKTNFLDKKAEFYDSAELGKIIIFKVDKTEL